MRRRARLSALALLVLAGPPVAAQTRGDRTRPIRPARQVLEPASPADTVDVERGLLALLGASFLALVVLAARKTRRRHAAPPALHAIRFRPGEAPVSAIELSSPDEVSSKLRELRCACGARAGDAGTRETLSYDERSLVLVSRTCQWCGEVESLYFDVGERAS